MKMLRFVRSRSKRYAYIAKWGSFRRQPWISFTEEISVEEAKRRFGFVAHPNAIGVNVGYSTYAPMEVTVDPR